MSKGKGVSVNFLKRRAKHSISKLETNLSEIERKLDNLDSEQKGKAFEKLNELASRISDSWLDSENLLVIIDYIKGDKDE